MELSSSTPAWQGYYCSFRELLGVRYFGWPGLVFTGELDELRRPAINVNALLPLLPQQLPHGLVGGLRAVPALVRVSFPPGRDKVACGAVIEGYSTGIQANNIGRDGHRG